MASKLDPALRADTDWGKPATEHLAAEPLAPAPLVKVRCISHSRPWTDKKGLEAGEIAEVSPAVAEVMLANRQVELVEEEKDK